MGFWNVAVAFEVDLIYGKFGILYNELQEFGVFVRLFLSTRLNQFRVEVKRLMGRLERIDYSIYFFQFKMGVVQFKMGIIQFKMGIVLFKMGIVHFKMGIVQFKMEKLL